MSTLLVLLALAGQPATIDTAVVCPNALRPAMQSWIDYRQQQGHRVVLVSSDGSAGDIRARLQAVAAQHPLRYVLLAGDADPRMLTDAGVRARSVPTHSVDSKVTVRFGSEPWLASDAPYADLDGDGVPELAVGRLPADSPQELAVMTARILAYEQAADGAWQRQINFIAGLSGMGMLVDSAIESLTRGILTDNIPAAYATSMTYAAWHSPYCPDPSHFREAALERLNEGCLFWVYIGHGQHRGVDEVQVPDGPYPILTCHDCDRLQAGANAPIALFLACYTGAFDATDDCLAEEMLRAPGGPIAVIAGSRVTMPYGMSVLGLGMLDACFVEQRETLGDCLLAAKRKALTAPRDDARSQLLDNTSRLLNPLATDLAAERREHVMLFNLLGDPLLRLHHSAAAQVSTASQVTAGEALEIAGTSPVDGEAEVDLIVSRGRLTFQRPERSRYETSESARREYQAVYELANDTRLATVRVPVVDGKFEARLAAPRQSAGDCHIRVFVHSPQGCALGACDVRIEPADRTADLRSQASPAADSSRSP